MPVLRLTASPEQAPAVICVPARDSIRQRRAKLKAKDPHLMQAVQAKNITERLNSILSF